MIIRPGQLGEGPPTGIVNVIDGKAGAIQRADLAAFALKAATDKSFAYIRKSPSVSSVSGTSWSKSQKAGFDGITSAL